MSVWLTGLDLVLATSPAGGMAGGVAAGVESVTPATWARLVGRLHPAAVHLPIGLILGAGILEVLGILRRRDARSKAALPCVLIAAPAAAMAAWFGWVGADVEPPGRSLAGTLLVHRWVGVAAAIAIGLAALTALLDLARTHRWLVNGYRGLLVLAVLLVMTGGYLGAEMVYGRGHLLEVFRTPTPRTPEAVLVVESSEAAPRAPLVPAPEVTSADETRVVFARDVQPILAERCVSCHGPRRRKAGLRLDSVEVIYGPDPEFWTVAPGRPEESLLYQRVVLPADHPDRMPARGEPLTPDQVDVIHRWIDEGGSAPAEIAASRAAPTPAPAPPTHTTRAAPAAPAVTPADPPAVDAGPTAAEAAARQHALDALRERGAVALALSEDSGLVDVNLSLVEPAATDDDLTRLAGLETTLVRLNLARSAITDAGLARLAGLTALRRLRLDNTGVGDTGLTHVAGLPRLEYLNLYGTRVTDAAVPVLTAMSALRQVYLWETDVSEAGLARLRADRRDLDVIAGGGLAVTREPEEAGEVAILPACCAAARAAGGVCAHPCCVEAAAAGMVCEKCADG